MLDREYRAMFELEERLWWYEGMRAVMAQILRMTASRSIALDVGCGTGYSILWLREQFKIKEAFGVDASRRAAELWKLRGISTAAIALAELLPFSSNQFDLVTCFDVIYQLQLEGARAALSEMKRVLRPGGLLLVREPAYDWLRGSHDIAVGTCRRYTLGELCRLIASQGLSIKRATYANTLLFGLAAAHRLVSRLLGGEKSDVRPLPELINRALLKTLKLESRLLSKINFPFGLSAIALARKPPE
jgi:ubiquinone/menaquinone biosynthesis C-methylase UbiE